MDIKALHQAIKELRDELERITVAIQRIEVIAEEVRREEQATSEELEPETHSDKPPRDDK